MKKIKVGIAGSRGLSTVMGLRALPDVEITALCNLDEATLDAQAKELGVAHKYRVFEDMLASDIDLLKYDIVMLAIREFIGGYTYLSCEVD